MSGLAPASAAQREHRLADADAFARARHDVLRRIAAACQRAGRDPADVALVAITKSVAPERIRAAHEAGQEIFGENRIQEADEKVSLITGARWHLVGRLQGNKARRALTLFEAIHSVDSVALAERLDRVASDLAREGTATPWRERVPVFLQVNVDLDRAKGGFAPDDVARSLPALAGLERLELLGLMTIGRLTDSPEEARPTFRRLRELAGRLHEASPALGGGLSMGMSDDYEVAVEEGSTMVRIGRALFGERRPG